MKILDQHGRVRTLAVWVLFASLSIAIAIMLFGDLVRSRNRAIAAERSRLQAQATLVSELLSGQLTAARAALENVRSDFSGWQKTGDWKRADSRLKALGEIMPGFSTLLLLDDKGTILAANRPELVGKNFSHREYFQRPRLGNAADTLFIGRPFSTVLSNITVPLSMRIQDAHGQFAGVAEISLDARFFHLVLDSVRYAEDMQAFIAHTDGTVFVVSPDAAPGFGSNLMDRVRRHGADGIFEKQLMTSEVVQSDAINADLSLIVGLSRNVDTILEPWYRDLRERSLLFFGSTALLALLLAWALHRRHEFDLLRAESRRQQLLASSVYENAQEGIIILDSDATILDVNPAFCDITGHARADAIGSNICHLMGGSEGDCPFTTILAEVRDFGAWRGEVWSRRKNGEAFPEALSVNIVYGEDGSFSHMISVFSDITQLKAQEQRLVELAHHDPLTGLDNRKLLLDRIGNALPQAQRAGLPIALAFIDLDGFKPINDSLGHAAGDAVLIEIARRLKICARAGDCVARIGGDEFVVMMGATRPDDDFEMAATRLLAAINECIELEGGQTVQVSGSLGLAIFPDDGSEADLLLRHADQAMYRAKTLGRNGFCRYAANN